MRQLLGELLSLGLVVGEAGVGEGMGAEGGEFVRGGQVVLLRGGGGTESKREEYPSNRTSMVVLRPYLLMSRICATFHRCSSKASR